MFFAANNISSAEANSAEANSFKTKQHLSGLNFLKLLFGIKNISFVVFILILFISKVNAKDCLSFLPYGFNDFYVHLPENKTFCVKEANISREYKTDNFGGRLLHNDLFDNKIQVFGDSQVLGLDIENIKQHYLHKIYKNSNFIIYAAPNNGPYEVINFLNINKNILNKKIVVTFNFSVDIYRVSYNWDPKNFVALRDDEIDEILEHPLKYKLIIFKNMLLNKNFTIARLNNKEMQNFFLNSSQNTIYQNLIKYFDELNKTAEELNLEIDFIITHPYWVYSKNKKKNNFLLEKKLNKKVEKLICKTFKKTRNIKNVYVSNIENQKKNPSLTYDKRHLKSHEINLIKVEKICSIS